MSLAEVDSNEKNKKAVETKRKTLVCKKKENGSEPSKYLSKELLTNSIQTELLIENTWYTVTHRLQLTMLDGKFCQKITAF